MTEVNLYRHWMKKGSLVWIKHGVRVYGNVVAEMLETSRKPAASHPPCTIHYPDSEAIRAVPEGAVSVGAYAPIETPSECVG